MIRSKRVLETLYHFALLIVAAYLWLALPRYHCPMMFFAIFVLIRTRFCVSVEREREIETTIQKRNGSFVKMTTTRASKQVSE